MASGRYLEDGEGPGRLVCIDPTKTGDISLELENGPGKGRPNPNSGAVWHFGEIRRTMSTVAVHDGLVIAPDFSGNVFCLDARTGQKYWQHHTRAHVFSCSPLIADGKVYIGNEDGVLFIFGLAKEKQVLVKFEFEDVIYSAPIYANGVLYVVAGETLFAIQKN